MNDKTPEDLQEAEWKRWLNTLKPNPPSTSQVNEFCSTLGLAISKWQMVECALYEVYKEALRSERPGALAASFASLQNSKIQLSLTDAAVQFVLLSEKQPDLLEEWNKLQSSVNEKLNRRNLLAHCQVTVNFYQRHDNDKIRLKPVSHDTRYEVGMKEAPQLRLSEIKAISDCFADLYNKLMPFALKIRQLKETTIGFLEPDFEE